MDVLSPFHFSPIHGLTLLLRYNESLRLQERRRPFNVSELQRLAAQSVFRNPSDIVSFTKIGEGAANRSFLVTFRDGFQMVARIPYPVTKPKGLVVASEAATLTFLRGKGVPVPKVYSYSASADNAAGTEYIFMEFSQDEHLSNIWYDLDEKEMKKFISSLVGLEAQLANISLPAFGSLFFHRDIPEGTEKVAIDPGDISRPESLYVGPSTALHLWHGKREELSVDRGPCRYFIRLKSVRLLTYSSSQGKRRTHFQRRERNLLSHSLRPTPTSVSKSLPRTFQSRKATPFHPPQQPSEIPQNRRTHDPTAKRVMASGFETSRSPIQQHLRFERPPNHIPDRLAICNNTSSLLAKRHSRRLRQYQGSCFSITKHTRTSIQFHRVDRRRAIPGIGPNPKTSASLLLHDGDGKEE